MPLSKINGGSRVWMSELAPGADKSAVGTINRPLRLIDASLSSLGADKSAVGAINRPLREDRNSSSSSVGVLIVSDNSEADKSAVGAINRPLREDGDSSSLSVGVSIEIVCCLPGSRVTLMLWKLPKPI